MSEVLDARYRCTGTVDFAGVHGLPASRYLRGVAANRTNCIVAGVLILGLAFAACSSRTTSGTGHLAGVLFTADGPTAGCRTGVTCATSGEPGNFELIGPVTRQVPAGLGGTFALAVPAGTYSVGPPKGLVECSSHPSPVDIHVGHVTRITVHCLGSAG